jgi:hypothetical protein
VLIAIYLLQIKASGVFFRRLQVFDWSNPMKFLQPFKLVCPGRAFLEPVLSLAIIIGSISVAGGAETDTAAVSDGSLAEIMATIVTPASDVIWNAVVFDITPDGESYVGPATDEEWNSVRTSAENLVAASTKMLSKDLPIRTTQVAEPPPGELNAEQIANLRNENWQAWAAHVNLLEVAGTTAISMVDAKDAKGLSDVGNSLYEACDSCHQKFWYPEG